MLAGVGGVTAWEAAPSQGWPGSGEAKEELEREEEQEGGGGQGRRPGTTIAEYFSLWAPKL